MSYRSLVSGRWVASWNSITSSTDSNGIVSYGFDAVLGLFVFNADGTLSGEFRLKSGIDYNNRPFLGSFDVTWDPMYKVFNGEAQITVIDTQNVNSLNFVRVNSKELTFIVEKAAKADGTLRTMMSHGTLHRVRYVAK